MDDPGMSGFQRESEDTPTRGEGAVRISADSLVTLDISGCRASYPIPGFPGNFTPPYLAFPLVRVCRIPGNSRHPWEDSLPSQVPMDDPDPGMSRVTTKSADTQWVGSQASMDYLLVTVHGKFILTLHLNTDFFLLQYNCGY